MLAPMGGSQSSKAHKEVRDFEAAVESTMKRFAGSLQHILEDINRCGVLPLCIYTHNHDKMYFACCLKEASKTDISRAERIPLFLLILQDMQYLTPYGPDARPYSKTQRCCAHITSLTSAAKSQDVC